MGGAEPRGRVEMPLGAALATALLCVAFGANVVAIRISVASFGPLTLAGLRFLLGGLVIAIWARTVGEPLALSGPRLRRLLFLSAAFTVQLALFYLGMKHTTASRGTLIGNLQPFVVLGLAHFLLPGERITVPRVLGMALGFAGVVTLFLDQGAVTSEARAGDFSVLGAVAIWACTTVWLKRIIDDYNSFQVAFYPMLVASPLLLAAGAIFDRPMVGVPTAAALGGLAYQAFVTAAIGFVAWNALFRRHGAVAMNSYLFLQPVAGVGLGAVLLGEPLASHGVLVGLPLVAAGIAVVNLRTKRSGPVRSSKPGWGGGIRTPD